MNTAEKQFFYLALFLFALGGVSRLGLLNKFSPLQEFLLETAPIAESVEKMELDTIGQNAISLENMDFENATFENIAFENSSKQNFKSTTKQVKAKKKAPSFPLKINSASKDDLCFIKGVGPSLAQKIIDYREQKGSFRSARDLEKVSGVGAKKRKAIEEFVVFD
ncbi:hypothetical protein AGMMS49938_03050 [Fibrobacterales bacterium]|nr:hypothetical protein AGMMS49938_03050 [Fibrobacterales bacterium]